MATHTIEIPDVPDDLLQQVDERARATGADRGSYLRSLIATALDAGPEETDRAAQELEDELVALLNATLLRIDRNLLQLQEGVRESAADHAAWSAALNRDQ